MVTFPFRTVPSKRNTSMPFAVQFPFRARRQSINTLGVSYQRLVDLELMVLHCHCLLNFRGTLCCCRSSDLSMFCDCRSTAKDFRYR